VMVTGAKFIAPTLNGDPVVSGKVPFGTLFGFLTAMYGNSEYVLAVTIEHDPKVLVETLCRADSACRPPG
jgi:hypothetical protein